MLLRQFGGVAVIKNPYSNAGQGVWTVTNDKDWEEFCNDPAAQDYDKFIVQSLIGNSEWSSLTTKGKLYHVGTIPNKNNRTYAADIRMMVHHTKDGWKPLVFFNFFVFVFLCVCVCVYIYFVTVLRN